MNEYLESYEHYLHSEHWGVTRKKYLTSESRCKVCGSTDRLELHHKTYTNLGKETEEDFLILCHSCHTKIHFNRGKKIKNLDKVMSRYLELFSQARYREKHLQEVREGRKKAKKKFSCASRYDKNFRYDR